MEIILKILATFVGLYFLFSLITFLIEGLKNPQNFNKNYPQSDYSRIPAYIGMGILVYFGTKEGFLYFLSDSWGSLDEDGEFVSVKSGVSGMVAFCSIFFISTFEDAVKKFSSIGLKEQEDELWKEYSEEFMEHFESLDKWGKKLIINNKLPTLLKIEKNHKKENKLKLENEEKTLEEKHHKELNLYLDTLTQEQKQSKLNNKLATLKMIDEEERILNFYCCDDEEYIAQEIEDYRNKYGVEALSDFKQMIDRLEIDFDGDREWERWMEIKVQRYLRRL